MSFIIAGVAKAAALAAKVAKVAKVAKIASTVGKVAKGVKAGAALGKGAKAVSTAQKIGKGIKTVKKIKGVADKVKGGVDKLTGPSSSPSQGQSAASNDFAGMKFKSGSPAKMYSPYKMKGSPMSRNFGISPMKKSLPEVNVSGGSKNVRENVTEKYKTKGNKSTRAHIKSGGQVHKNSDGSLSLSKISPAKKGLKHFTKNERLD